VPCQNTVGVDTANRQMRLGNVSDAFMQFVFLNGMVNDQGHADIGHLNIAHYTVIGRIKNIFIG